MMRKLFLFAVICLMLVIPVLAQDSAPSGELVISLASEPTSLYLPRAADLTAYNASLPMYDTLVTYDEATHQYLPKLAESWDVSADGKQYTFHLRHGVTFQNGESFTADAVVETWTAGKDPSNVYPMLYTVASNVAAVDDYTVHVSMDKPQVGLMDSVRAWAIVAPAYMRKVGIDAFAKNPIGSGPFEFDQWIPGDRIVLKANPNYWQKGYPKLVSVVFRIIPDSSTRLAAIQTGEIDVANRLTADDATQLANASNVKVLSYSQDSVFYVGFKNIGNGVGTPLENVKVRQALNYAVNRQGMITAIFGGGASLVSGFVLSRDLGYTDAMQPYPYDPDKAKQLLSDAGYAKGFSISMGCPTDAYPNINEVCLAIQRDLSAVGIDLTVDFKTSNSYWSDAAYGSVGPMYVDGWGSSGGEALGRLQGALVPKAFYNTWVDDKLTGMIDQISTTLDTKARAALYVKLQQYMYDDPPFIYLYSPIIYEAYSTKITGYSPDSGEVYDLTGVSKSS